MSVPRVRCLVCRAQVSAFEQTAHRRTHSRWALAGAIWRNARFPDRVTAVGFGVCAAAVLVVAVALVVAFVTAAVGLR